MSRSKGIGRHPPSQKTHGHSFVDGKASPEYNAWHSMKSRCVNPNDKNHHRYGGRGISVCKRWLDSFEDFLADVGSRPSGGHSLDRYPDNNGNYEPGNIRWATKFEQARNTRLVNIVIYQGEPISLPDLTERLGLRLPTVRQRINRGWPLERALK
jgi:hypothetical protein